MSCLLISSHLSLNAIIAKCEHPPPQNATRSVLNHPSVSINFATSAWPVNSIYGHALCGACSPPECPFKLIPSGGIPSNFMIFLHLSNVSCSCTMANAVKLKLLTQLYNGFHVIFFLSSRFRMKRTAGVIDCLFYVNLSAMKSRSSIAQ